MVDAIEETAHWGQRGTAGVAFASALRFQDVSVRLGAVNVLDHLDLILRPGEIVCLLGESGSGKSTTLRVAAGILPLDAGSVSINDKEMSGHGTHVPPDRRGVGLMFQDFALFPHLSVLENVLFGLRHLDRASARQQALAALARVGLANRAGDYPHRLSGGQQQRLALARSVAPRPGLLLLDEPFSSLDARLRETVRGETLAVLRETRSTSLIVTHDPEEAMLLGDRVALMRKGRIVQIDTAERIYRAPASLYAARFFSPLGEVETTVRDGSAETPIGRVATPNHADGHNVIVAIRPAGGVEIRTEGPGTPGRIVSKRDAIGEDVCEVKVEGLDEPIGVRQRSSGQLRVGLDVFVSLNEEHILVFDRD